jgi:hypothetical protein
MNGRKIGLAVWACGALAAFPLKAQEAPRRPSVLTITREMVKPGHAATHEEWETGWPRMSAKYDSPFYTLALTAISGPPEAWYLTGYDSFEHLGEYYKWMSDHPGAAAEDARLSAGDAVHLDGIRFIQAQVREDLSNGPMPDLAKVRAFMISTIRVRLGQDATFEALLKQWAGALRSAGTTSNWGTYQVVTGMPEGTYLLLMGFPSLGGVDASRATDGKAAAAMGQAAMAEFMKRLGESAISSEAQLFLVSPRMSWVPKAMADADPGFWRPRPAVASVKKPTP